MKRTFFFLVAVWFFFTPYSLFAKTYLVTADITDYPGSDRDLTKYSQNSALDFEAAYRKSDSTLVCTRLKDNQVTNANLIAAIHNLFDYADTGDIVIVYLHGHGYKGGFSTFDGWLDYKELRTAIAKSKSHHKMIFADCCHSGSLRSNPPDSNAARFSKRAARRSNVMLFLSSRPDEVSWVTTKYYKGYFCAYLCKAFSGEADINKDNVVTARELYTFVKKGVVEETSVDDPSKAQHPVMWGNFPDDMPVIRLSSKKN